MKYLFLSPHPDDVELACGATIARLVWEGHSVEIAVFSDCGIDPEEMKRSHEILGATTSFYNFPRRRFDQHRQEILDCLISIRDMINPDGVFLPDQSDIHQDHRVIGLEGLRAFKMVPYLIGYAHAHNQLEVSHNYYMVLEDRYVDLKLKALAHFVSQHNRFYFHPDNILGTMLYYGSQSGTKYAEAFRLIRHINSQILTLN